MIGCQGVGTLYWVKAADVAKWPLVDGGDLGRQQHGVFVAVGSMPPNHVT